MGQSQNRHPHFSRTRQMRMHRPSGSETGAALASRDESAEAQLMYGRRHPICCVSLGPQHMMPWSSSSVNQLLILWVCHTGWAMAVAGSSCSNKGEEGKRTERRGEKDIHAESHKATMPPSQRASMVSLDLAQTYIRLFISLPCPSF